MSASGAKLLATPFATANLRSERSFHHSERIALNLVTAARWRERAMGFHRLRVDRLVGLCAARGVRGKAIPRPRRPANWPGLRSGEGCSVVPRLIGATLREVGPLSPPACAIVFPLCAVPSLRRRDQTWWKARSPHWPARPEQRWMLRPERSHWELGYLAGAGSLESWCEWLAESASS